jgi:hypothetical protein
MLFMTSASGTHRGAISIHDTVVSESLKAMPRMKKPEAMDLRL